MFNIKDEPKTLCDSCRYLDKVRFQSGRILRSCKELPSDRGRDILREPVEECSMYIAVNQMTKREAYQLGWVLDPSKNGIGFMPPKAARERGVYYDGD